MKKTIRSFAIGIATGLLTTVALSAERWNHPMAKFAGRQHDGWAVVEQATWSNSIGDSDLITVWQDPGFDPQQAAFYYARVIEIPTPRWTAYDARRYNVKVSEEVPMTIQERAYTSPIWYTP